MKALVGAFNQEKALVGAFSVILQPVVEPMDRFAALVSTVQLTPGQQLHAQPRTFLRVKIWNILIKKKRMGSNCSSRFSSNPAPHIVVQNVQSMFHVMESRNKEQMHEQFGERDSQSMC